MRVLLKLQLYMVIGFVVVLLPLYFIYILKHSEIIANQVLLFTLFTVMTIALLYTWYRATSYLIVGNE